VADCHSEEVVALIVRVARENPRWGNPRIGRAEELGIRVLASSVRNVVRRADLALRTSPLGTGVAPVPTRPGIHDAREDFFTVESIRPRTLYVLFSGRDCWVSTGRPTRAFIAAAQPCGSAV
jgi:putative transposase